MNQDVKITTTVTAQFLRGKYGTSNFNVQPLGSGVWSYAYLFEHNGVKKVIRWGDVPDNFERDAFASQFNESGLPIPAIFEIGAYSNQYYAISAYATGSFLEQLLPEDITKTVPSIQLMFSKLRAIDLSFTEGYGFFDQLGKGSHKTWKEFLLDDKNESKGSLIHGWKEILQSSEFGMTAYDNLWNKFRSLIAFCPEDRCLVHSDSVNRNILVENAQITAVLDWGSAFIGDPLYDIAWIKYCEPWSPYFKSANVVQLLLDDYCADPNANTINLEKRMQCYLLNIGAGSLTYNAFRRDWKTVGEIVEYTNKLFS